VHFGSRKIFLPCANLEEGRPFLSHTRLLLLLLLLLLHQFALQLQFLNLQQLSTPLSSLYHKPLCQGMGLPGSNSTSITAAGHPPLCFGYNIY